ncbi:MAG: ATP-binding protein [Clostridia bacterium]|nr:ATP-binding protein [Clostridia bacterium]MDE7215852.1 ATP-binding protein [Clostridia bacterium]
MIKFFSQKLDILYSSRRAIAKENSRNSNRKILAAHTTLADMLKEKKALELELARKKARRESAEDDETSLSALNGKIADYVKTNSLNFAAKYSCPICKDEGYINGNPCKCLLEEYNTLLRQYASVSPIPKFTFADNSYASSERPEILAINKLFNIMEKKVCDNFQNCKWSNFIFSGASGIGKTSLAAAVANDLLEKNISVFYVTAFELINVFLDKHTNKQSAMSKLFDYVSNCEMLIIDNLGSEPIYKNVTLEYLFSTLEKRLADKKKTMICTQLGAQALINRYGESFLKFADKKHSLSVILG